MIIEDFFNNFPYLVVPGNRNEVAQALENIPDNGKYPVLVLTEPFSWNDRPTYREYENVRVILAHITEAERRSPERTAKVYKTVLYPMLNEFDMYCQNNSIYFNRGKRTKRPYISEGDANVNNDLWDAFTIDFNINITKKELCQK